MAFKSYVEEAQFTVSKTSHLRAQRSPSCKRHALRLLCYCATVTLPHNYLPFTAVQLQWEGGRPSPALHAHTRSIRSDPRRSDLFRFVLAPHTLAPAPLSPPLLLLQRSAPRAKGTTARPRTHSSRRTTVLELARARARVRIRGGVRSDTCWSHECVFGAASGPHNHKSGRRRGVVSVGSNKSLQRRKEGHTHKSNVF